MTNGDFEQIQNELRNDFNQLLSIQNSIHNKLKHYCDGKLLKGDELVGWLGEIYVKKLFSGVLVDDSYEHDVETPDGCRISVKTRRGNNSGWQRTSSIPKIIGKDSPTHLVFVHLNYDYSVNKIWKYDWNILLQNNRLKEHYVRENLRGYYFSVSTKNDKSNIIYP